MPRRPRPSDDGTYFERLVREPCLLAEDVIMISVREREPWRRFASTAEHSLWKADWSLPFLVVRTHDETVDDETLRFVLLAMRHEDEDHAGAIFGELACSPAIYDELVKEYGLERPVPREARGAHDDVPTPDEMDEQSWRELLGGGE